MTVSNFLINCTRRYDIFLFMFCFPAISINKNFADGRIPGCYIFGSPATVFFIDEVPPASYGTFFGFQQFSHAVPSVGYSSLKLLQFGSYKIIAITLRDINSRIICIIMSGINLIEMVPVINFLHLFSINIAGMF